eukprot:COSAG01_NODE_57850_length_309_cov_2.004762_1_plen_68_part_01
MAEKFKSDREFVLAAVARNGLALEFAIEKFKSDREVVLERRIVQVLPEESKVSFDAVEDANAVPKVSI